MVFADRGTSAYHTPGILFRNLPPAHEPAAIAELWIALRPTQLIVESQDESLVSAISHDELRAPTAGHTPIPHYLTNHDSTGCRLNDIGHCCIFGRRGARP